MSASPLRPTAGAPPGGPTTPPMPRRSRRTLLLAAALLPLLPLAGAAAQQPTDRGRFRSWIDTTVAFQRDGHLDLTEIAGDVVVDTWDRDEVRVRAWAERGRVEASLSPSRVLLRTQRGTGRNVRESVGQSGMLITVPANARLKIVTTSGDMRLTGVRGELEASTTSGDVAITDGGSLTSVGTVSGDVTVRGLAGDLIVKTTSGDVIVSGTGGEVRVATVSGDVSLREAGSRAVTARTTNGSVTYEGAFARGGRYEFATHSGDVRLVLPAGVNAEMTMQSFSGAMDTDFPVTLAGARSATRPRTLEFVIGEGGARVRAETFSGDVVLRRSGRDR